MASLSSLIAFLKKQLSYLVYYFLFRSWHISQTEAAIVLIVAIMIFSFVSP